MNASKVLELVNTNELTKLIELAKKEIQENETKKKYGVSESKRIKLVQKYLENAKKIKEHFGKTWIFDGKQIICNGYTGFIFEKHIENLPCETNKSKLEEVERLTKFLFGCCEIEAKILTAFNVADVKASLKIQKTEHKKICTYDIGEFTYDAKFLIDCTEILGGENMEFYQSKFKNRPSVFVSENGKAVILPFWKK